MNKKKIIGLVVAGVVVVVGIVGGVAYHKYENTPSSNNTFEQLVNKDYKVVSTATKESDCFKYELNIEGKLDANDAKDIALQAMSVAKNPSEIVVNEFKDGAKDFDTFNGFVSPDLQSKAVLNKEGGKLMTFKELQVNKDKATEVGEFASTGTEKIDGIDALKITLKDDKDIVNQGNAIVSSIVSANKDNQEFKDKAIIVDVSKDGEGVFFDSQNPNLEIDYTSFS